MFHSQYRGGNLLLDSIPAAERSLILRHCESAVLKQGEAIAFPDEKIHFVYFPINCVIAVMAQADGKDALAMALIGREGMVGTSLMMGVDSWTFRATAEHGGEAMFMTAEHFRRTLLDTPDLARRLLLLASEAFEQSLQAAACAVSHSVEERLAYWLLMIGDRVQDEDFYMTTAMFARLLGVSLHAISLAIHTLQGGKLIVDQHDHLAILNREGLTLAACGCYEILSANVSKIESPHNRREHAAPIKRAAH